MPQSRPRGSITAGTRAISSRRTPTAQLIRQLQLTLAEPEALPHGDDRVIALFPTAAARRSRTIVAPTDPDGQS